MIKNTDIAYAAGYIDGDGCFHIRKDIINNRTSPKYRAQIIISSVNNDVLIWFKETFGGSISHPKKIILGREKHKPVYHYSLLKKQGIIFTKDILHYLVEKLQEAQTYLIFAQSPDTKEKDSSIENMKILKNDTNLVSKDLKIEFEKLKNTVEPSLQDYAYFAGFIDAECCFQIVKDKPKNKPNYVYKIRLQCNNSKSPIFKWIIERFGGSMTFIDRRSKNPNHRNQFCWYLSGKSLANILSKISPFLKFKKPVCDELIKFYATTLTNGGARHTDEFRAAYAKVIEEREQIVTKVHLLNLKGIT